MNLSNNTVFSMKIHYSSFITAGLGICPVGVFSYVMNLYTRQFFLSWIAAKELYFFKENNFPNNIIIIYNLQIKKQIKDLGEAGVDGTWWRG